MIDAPRTPEGVPLLTYTIVIILSVWGGIANFLMRMKKNLSIGFFIAELLGEMVIASFAGMMMFLLCAATGVTPLLTAALVGVSGHMGSRIIFQMEMILSRKFSFFIKFRESGEQDFYSKVSTDFDKLNKE